MIYDIFPYQTRTSNSAQNTDLYSQTALISSSKCPFLPTDNRQIHAAHIKKRSPTAVFSTNSIFPKSYQQVINNLLTTPVDNPVVQLYQDIPQVPILQMLFDKKKQNFVKKTPARHLHFSKKRAAVILSKNKAQAYWKCSI